MLRILKSSEEDIVQYLTTEKLMWYVLNSKQILGFRGWSPGSLYSQQQMNDQYQTGSQ